MRINNKTIISSIDVEITTDKVIKYLIYLNIDFVRTNSSNYMSNISLEISNSSSEDRMYLEGSEKTIVAKPKDVMWYRKGDFSYTFPFPKNSINNRLRRYLVEEWTVVKSFIHNKLRFLGGYDEEYGNNKIIDLYTAKLVGLEIPNTLITTNKKDLLCFATPYQQILTKPIHNGHISFVANNKRYSSKGILLLKPSDIEKGEDYFSISLFQEYIEKEYEIRVFFLDEKLYSMAIFSQLDEKTKYDFRNYNRERPNRCVPYRMPEHISSKIINFMNKSNLTTGSIDIIYTKNKKYVFLEVNPAGQFGWLSTNCNYYLEMKIAQQIKHKNT